MKETKLGLLILLLAIALAILFAYWLIMGFVFPSDLAEKGQFGDMFGSVNALFSACAFAGLIYAIFLQKQELGLQRQELRLQRDELQQTREELRGQKEQLEGQRKQLEIQNFEHKFFELLNLFNQLVVNLQDEVHKVRGRGCIEKWMSEIRKSYRELYQHFEDDHSKLVKATYLQVFDRLPDEASNYFRVLYNIIKFVDESNIENPKSYTNLARALLTENELLVIFYNCLSQFGSDRFKGLVEKYAILKHVREGKLLDPAHKEMYDKSAFA